MNDILILKGNEFTQEKRKGSYRPAKLPKKAVVELSKLKEIHKSLLKVKAFWEKNTIVNGALVSVYYNQITAKSNRISGYLSKNSSSSINDTIVGAKFNRKKTRHIITHYIPKTVLENTIKTSSKVIKLFEESFGDKKLSSEQFNEIRNFSKLDYKLTGIPKTTFRSYLRDSCFVEKFGVEEAEKEDLSNAIVTFYNIDKDIKDILGSIDVDITPANILDQTTVLLDEKNVELVFSRIPYLVSMAVSDINELSPVDVRDTDTKISAKIPSPTNEPTIGVIDTLFEENVYFSKWVEYHDMISNQISKETMDYRHGTAVSSLIVDTPNLNPDLDDGCGRFRVRHFGVSLHNGFSSFNIVKQIKEIVSQNTDIKVWNLSLGSNSEIKDNFISSEAAVLDEIQFKYDVIFVIAGTNASDNIPRKKIGSPADSLNSVVVNAVDFHKTPTKYVRQGIVLSFFVKPDVAYYGGGGNGDYINVCEPFGLAKVTGTSFAAPLIARKLAYLIYIIGLNREEAKALLIDSAISWNDEKTFEDQTLTGYGVVPIKIKDILKVPEDEIKFIVSDVSKKYNTYNYNFPVPILNNKYPYIAKVTMCYFPKCSRNQGVDYTNTELDIHFGPLSEKDGIAAVNYNKQNLDNSPGYIKEETARNLFRKWDNVKSIREKFTPKKKEKIVKNKINPQWGMSVKTIERLGKSDGKGIRFGVVVTLKELHGVNRIEEFIKQSELRGWIINRIHIEKQVAFYNKKNEDIDFEW